MEEVPSLLIAKLKSPPIRTHSWAENVCRFKYNNYYLISCQVLVLYTLISCYKITQSFLPLMLCPINLKRLLKTVWNLSSMRSFYLSQCFGCNLMFFCYSTLQSQLFFIILTLMIKSRSPIDGNLIVRYLHLHTLKYIFELATSEHS